LVCDDSSVCRRQKAKLAGSPVTVLRPIPFKMHKSAQTCPNVKSN